LLNAKPTTKVEAISILPSLNVKTARSWRAILLFTHLAREGRMTVTIGRRELLVALGGAAAWPLAARAGPTTMPPLGFLSSRSQSDLGLVIPGFQQGLNAAGFAEGRNIAIEYRWAEGDYQRLPALAADLVNRKVAVVAAISGTPSALAAKAATTTIPTVFAIGSDPAASGL